MTRRVARIWKRGGFFWKSEKSANDLDPNFHCSRIRISREARKSKRFFRPKTGGLQKKKGLHRNWDWFFSQNRIFKRFFRPNHDMYFTTSEPNFLWGAVFNFSPKIGLKSSKTCDFAYFSSIWGGAPAPPPPPLATLLHMTIFLGGQTKAFLLRHDRAYLNVNSEESIMCVIMKCNQGRQEGGKGVQWPRGPWTFGGPWASLRPLEFW